MTENTRHTAPRSLSRVAARTAVSLALTVLLFALGRLVCLAVNGAVYAGVTAGDVAAALWHGVPMDLTVGAYVTALPLLGWLTALWRGGALIDKVLLWYYLVIAAVLTLCILLDAALYSYWQFKLDVTPFSYFVSSPSAALASATWWQAAGALVAWVALTWCVWQAYCRCVLRLTAAPAPVRGAAGIAAAIVGGALLCGGLFVLMRGGVTVSTMNISRAYHSPERRLNHLSVNPAFSLLYSATHQGDFGSRYRYFDTAEAERLYAVIAPPAEDSADTEQLLRVSRPDIYVIILESFSSHLMPSLGGADVATGLDSIAATGLLWTNFYASSFRTDRGIPAILSGYPGQPDTSVMKYVSKTDRLPSVAGVLSREAGYDTYYYYGGDINFCNQQAYLVSGGYRNIVSDKDFDVTERLSKWGAHDEVVFRCVLADKRPHDPSAPRFTVIQTSSSHEPFETPYRGADRWGDKRAVAFAYTDSVVTAFVDALRHRPGWDNTLVIMVPDHYGAWPELTDPVARHQIPLVMTGGALALHGRRDEYGTQTDIAATLLGALGLDHSDFSFSHNLLDPAAPHFGYFTDPSYIGMTIPEATLIYNLDTDTAEEGAATDGATSGATNGVAPASCTDVPLARAQGGAALVPYAKAYLQTLYTDLDSR